MKNIIILISILFIFYRDVCADVHVASSTSAADVQTAINAASDGDTVQIPAGSSTWTTQVTGNKAIRTVGAGLGNTNITNNYDSSSGAMWISTYSGAGNRDISQISFIGDGANNNEQSLRFLGLTPTRIHHCNFTGAGTAIRIITEDGFTGAVIDHCNFTGSLVNAELIQVNGADAATTWTADSTLGEVDALYVEDCTFVKDSGVDAGGHAIMGSKGARYVFRYNTVADMDIDAHGNCPNRATRQFEIYNNTCTVSSGKSLPFWIYLRGGTGVVHNNTMTVSGTLNNGDIFLQEHQIRRDCPTQCLPGPETDQLGRGKDQVLDPIYEWNNTVDAADIDYVLNDFTPDNSLTACGTEQFMTDYFTENTDYYADTERPSYTAFTYPHPLTLTTGILIQSGFSIGSGFQFGP